MLMYLGPDRRKRSLPNCQQLDLPMMGCEAGGSAYLSQEMLHLETSIINLQLRRSREAKDAIRKGVEQIHNAKGHGPEGF